MGVHLRVPVMVVHFHHSRHRQTLRKHLTHKLSNGHRHARLLDIYASTHALKMTGTKRKKSKKGNENAYHLLYAFHFVAEKGCDYTVLVRG